MSLFSTRRFASACVLSAAVTAALVVPGAASALGGAQCSGVDIEGKGASLQKLSQIETWTPEFKAAANPSPLACNGANGSKEVRTVTYTSTGSGAGLRSWAQEPKEAKEINYGPKGAYVGTDEPPNKVQKEEMESHGAAGSVLTIPVEQAAVTVAVHLPANCTAVEGGPVPGRLGLKAATVEKIFQGTVTKWSQVLNKAKLVGAGCNKLTLIKRVVRKDGSGTTSLVKKWFNVVFRKEVEPGKTWQKLAESANNTTWPNEATDPVVRGEGNGGVAKEVANNANAGSIGYINLADARANKSFSPPTGGAGKTTFWIEVENAAKPVPTFADPSTNGDAEVQANSNCEETLYINGKKKFPPPTTEEVWNEVSAAKAQKNYPICGFTYDLSLTKFSAFTVAKGSQEEPTEKEARTAFDYLNFVLSAAPGGGQALIGANEDYLGLPTAAEAKANVLKIAQEGQAKIGF
jgi:ABC-type phosphate transport system substrate-binding protein